MPCLAIYWTLLTLGQPPGHADNPVLQPLLRSEVELGGIRVRLPAPSVPDGLSAADQRRALLEVAGSGERLGELLRDSVTAPFQLKVRDEKSGRGDLVRLGDLWFVIRADLDRLDPKDFERLGADGKPVEAGNMRISSRLLTSGELEDRGLKAATANGGSPREWYVHMTGRLLDRIAVDATERVTASRSAESWVVASRTEPKFARDESFPNQWRSVRAEGSQAPPRPYAGGASYVKITRLADPKGALLVEAHFAFSEPFDWFEGAPILRSKISLIAQDRIRGLRRELARSQKGGEPRKG